MGQNAKAIRSWADVYFALHLILGALLILMGLFCVGSRFWLGTGLGVGIGLFFILICLPFRALALGFAVIVENQEEQMEGRHLGVRYDPSKHDGSLRR